MNYRIHTDAIKKNLIPEKLNKYQTSIIYANEADVLNMALFEEKEIRKIWKENKWYFSIIDIIYALTESSNPRRYWSDLKIKLKNEGYDIELYEIIVQLKLKMKLKDQLQVKKIILN